MPEIKILSDQTINKIAAGEVVERPISVVKELVENALDAGATFITVELERGGRNLISVTDNGHGISKEQLSIAVERHATSKLDEKDINNISFYGFRGEALPSIGAVAKLRITSKTASSDVAWCIEVNGGTKSQPTPATKQNGTTVEVFDIFCFTPTRLKFLRSEANEKTSAIDLMERFALANHNIAFKLIIDGKVLLNLTAQPDLEQRIFEIFGNDFKNQSIKFENTGESISVHGFTSLPTLNYPNQNKQYLFVNKRVVKDKLLLIAIRAAYQNLIAERRHPSAVLFVNIDPYAVDVNVHPAKAEVRFRDQDYVRNFIINSIRNALRQTLIEKSHTQIANNDSAPGKALGFSSMNASSQSKTARSLHERNESKNYFTMQRIPEFNKIAPSFYSKGPEAIETTAPSSKPIENLTFNVVEKLPLGHAKFQAFNTYIVAHCDDGVLIIDQHAAHERLVLEQFKAQMAEQGQIKTQSLLVPEVIELGQSRVEKLLEFEPQLRSYGFEFERNGISQIAVRQVPSLLNTTALKEIFKDLAEELEDRNNLSSLDQIKEEILGNLACHYSIRSGRALTLPEMEKMLRDIEKTPFAGQCNHGRPTYIKLTKDKLAKLFERT